MDTAPAPLRSLPVRPGYTLQADVQHFPHLCPKAQYLFLLNIFQNGKNYSEKQEERKGKERLSFDLGVRNQLSCSAGQGLNLHGGRESFLTSRPY